MKFSERWLRTLVDPALSSEQLAELLTMAGLEVEAREPVAPAFSGVVVAEVMTVERHPAADRLSLCHVDIGEETLEVVCGAPNVRAGMRVACARPGAQLPSVGVERVQVRGIESAGMLCSARELGLGEDHSGLLELGSEATLGADLRTQLDLDDWTFTLKLTPNRGDCLSLYGLAREVAALSAKNLKLQPAKTVLAATTAERAIHLDASASCPRYCGRVIEGVNAAAPTPDWIRRRLERCGVRPISALVDVTNYVMLELGQPLHAFDHARLEGAIHVRFAQPGERLRLLDGREVTLQPAHLLIADERKALALAGVMGGEHSAVSDSTRAVFLESAFFDPETVANASRGLEIASDAAHRFERGVDYAISRQAIERATALILQICGGKAGPVSEATATLPTRARVRVRPEQVNGVLGIDLGVERMQQILQVLGMQVERAGAELAATAPSYRFDIEIEEDLIEEIARVHGYNRIEAALPVAEVRMLPLPEHRIAVARLKEALAARDYLEVVTFSFVDRGLEADFAGEDHPVALMNPIATSMSVMRSTLLGSLVECARYNAARRQERVRIFEVAACYRGRAGGFEQTERVAGLCYGAASVEQWGEKLRPVDLFDVRGDLEALLGAARVRLDPASHPAFHPGQCARVLVDGASAGWIGALHPALMHKYELADAAVGFELDLTALQARPLPAYQPIPRFQPVRRDIALLVDSGLAAEVVREEIERAGSPLVSAVTLFDVYLGEGVPEGRKSLAFRVLLQDTEKTLTEAEVESQIQRVLRVLQQKHGAILRA